MSKTEYMYRPDTLLQLVDAIGLSMVVRKPNPACPEHYTLHLDRETFKSYRSKYGALYSKIKVLDSYLLPTESTTTAVRLSIMGNLQLLFLMGHNKHSMIECYVLDGSKIEPDAKVLETRWSRLRTLYAIRNAVVAHYTYVPRRIGGNRNNAIWAPTPKAKKFVEVYLTARSVHEFATGDAELFAGHVVNGRLSDDDEVMRKWKKSTDLRRDEMLKAHEEAAS